MILKVLPIVTIPHVINKPINGRRMDLIFNPICKIDIPESLGKALIKTYPNKFAASSLDEKVDRSKYEVSDSFKNQTMQQVFEKLSADDKVEIFTLAVKKLQGEPGTDEKAAADKAAADKK